MTVEMMAEKEGKEAADDVIKVCKLPEAIAALQDVVDAGKTGPRALEFRGVHRGKGVATEKSLHELLTAFLYWAQKPEDRDAGRFNITKAFRRLKSFAEYQEKYFHKIFADPLLDTEPGVQASSAMMPIQIPAWTCQHGNVCGSCTST